MHCWCQGGAWGFPGMHVQTWRWKSQVACGNAVFYWVVWSGLTFVSCILFRNPIVPFIKADVRSDSFFEIPHASRCRVANFRDPPRGPVCGKTRLHSFYNSLGMGEMHGGEGCFVWVVATTGPSELGFADQEKELDMSAHILAQGFQRLNEASP